MDSVYLIRVYKNRAPVARKVFAAASFEAAQQAGRAFCRSVNGGSFVVRQVQR